MDYKEIFDLILDENNFTVGGGSSSAIAGAMACGLMGMVANLSKSKGYGYVDSTYDEIINRLNVIKNEFLISCVEDNKAYLLIVNAYKLPKTTEEEKEVRKSAIQEAGIKAASVPLLNAKLNKEVFEIEKELLENSNPSCYTDLHAGILLSESGLKMGKENVEVNLSLIKDEKIKKELVDELEKL